MNLILLVLSHKLDFFADRMFICNRKIPADSQFFALAHKLVFSACKSRYIIEAVRISICSILSALTSEFEKPMNNLMLEKTDKGREEVATRKYRLPSKIRSLLVMIDGNTPMENLMKKAMAIGLDEKSFTELMSGQFVRDIKARYDQ